METFLCLNPFTFFNGFKLQFSTVELNLSHFDVLCEVTELNWK